MREEADIGMQMDKETMNEVEAPNAHDNTFNLGENTTAKISAINSMFAGGDVNESMLSLGSKSSMASNASSVASSDMDVMNCTTTRDTHKLLTSNFI